MSPSQSQRRSSIPQSPEALAQEALTSQDGMLIADNIKKLEASDAPALFIEHTLRDIVKAHPEMTPVVIGCLSTLDRFKSPELRPLCRLIINAPFHSDRDLIVGHAAGLLANHPNPDQLDVLLLAKAVDHRSEHVKTSVRRALSQISREVGDGILARAAELPSRPQLEMLKRLVRRDAPLFQLVLPPAPQADSLQGGRGLVGNPAIPSADVPKRSAGENLVPFSTPVAEALAAESKNRPQTDKPERTKPRRQSLHAEMEGPIRERLAPHRIAGYHLLSDTALSHKAILSTNYREVAAALVEYTLRRGIDTAKEFHSRLVYALSDPENRDKFRFEEIARVWFSEPN